MSKLKQTKASVEFMKNINKFQDKVTTVFKQVSVEKDKTVIVSRTVNSNKTRVELAREALGIIKQTENNNNKDNWPFPKSIKDK